MVSKFSDKSKNKDSKKLRKSSDFRMNDREPKRFEAFLSRNFLPSYRFQQRANTVRSDREPSKVELRYFSKKELQEAKARNFLVQSRNEKLDWKEKGVNPITLNMPSKVFPYGGGLAPARQMTKQELVTLYLGSRAVANIIMQKKIEKGTANVSRLDAQTARNRLIKGDIKDGESVPLIPYPVPYQNGQRYFAGTLEQAAIKNKRWWNDNTEGLQFRPIRENQTELDDEQVNAVWDRVSPELYYKVGNSLLDQEIGRERLVPSVKGHTPLVTDVSGEFVPARHGFDFDGNVNSARNQELTQIINSELETVDFNQSKLNPNSKEYQSLEDRKKLLKQSEQRVTEERILKPRWAAMQDDEDTETFEDVKRNAGVAGNNLNFWGAPLEERKDFDSVELQDAVVKWNLEQQYNSLHLGHWETNYLNPELEPGMFAAPENVEYRTLGVNDIYNERIAREMTKDENRENKPVNKGTVERRYIFGRFDPLDYRPKSEDEKRRFDFEVSAAMLNTQNSDQYNRAIVKWRKGGEKDGKDEEGKSVESALYYTAPNENQKRLEENFAENQFASSAQKTTRHEFARNIAPTSELQNDLLNEVQPLNDRLLQGAYAQSVEKGIREERKIWGEFARVRGDGDL